MESAAAFGGAFSSVARVTVAESAATDLQVYLWMASYFSPVPSGGGSVIRYSRSQATPALNGTAGNSATKGSSFSWLVAGDFDSFTSTTLPWASTRRVASGVFR